MDGRVNQGLDGLGFDMLVLITMTTIVYGRVRQSKGLA